MNDTKMFSAAAHGLNVMKTLLPTLSAKARAASGGTSFAETLVSVRTRVETVSVTVTKTSAEMTMTEYQEYLTAKLDAIPWHPNRFNDEESITITDAGWERLKNDPEYEKKLLDDIAIDRSYYSPLLGTGGTYCTRKIGATVEEYEGWSWSKQYGFGSAEKSSSMFEEKSRNCFWSNRRKRMKELYKESEERYLRRKKEMQMENLHVRKMRLMAQGKYDAAASVVGTGVPASLLLSGIGGTGTEL